MVLDDADQLAAGAHILAVGGQHQVAGLHSGSGGGVAVLNLANHHSVGRETDQADAHHQHERQQHVHQRPGGEDPGLLPAVFTLPGALHREALAGVLKPRRVRRVALHPGNAHEAADGERADVVARSAPLEAGQRRAHADGEVGHGDTHRFGCQHVAQLVDEDDYPEDENDG